MNSPTRSQGSSHTESRPHLLVGSGVLRAALLVAFLSWVLAAQEARAANGDILASAAHCQAGFITGSSDSAYDLGDNTLWVLDRGTGQICHYSLAVGIQSIGTIAHPYGAAGFSDLDNISTGLAYDSTGNGGIGTLWVLNGDNPGLDPPSMREINKATGAAIGAEVPLTLPFPDSSYAGLTYDHVTDSLWTRDVQHNLLVNLSFAGAIVQTIALPGVAANETIFGTGLHFFASGANRFLSYTVGNVIDYRVALVKRVNVATGANVGYSIDLADLYEPGLGGNAETGTNPLTGIALNPTQTHLYIANSTTVYRVDAVQPTVQPPSMVTCFSLPNGNIKVSWMNNGAGAGGAYVNLQVYRLLGAQAPLLGTLPGGTTMYTDTAITDPAQPQLLNTTVVYRLVGIGGTGNSPEVFCEARTGRGALVGYAPFHGENPYDIAYNPNTAELYVTDNKSYPGTTGRIYVYNENLALLRTITISLPFTRGIAYNDHLNLFAFSAGSNQAQLGNLRFLDPTTDTQLGVAVPISAPAPNQTIELGAMTYDSAARDYLAINRFSGRLLRLEAEDDGSPTTEPNPGTYLDQCTAPFANYSRAVTYLPDLGDGTYLATIENVGGQTATQIEEFDVNCFQSSNTIPLNAIGRSVHTAGAVNGMENVGNQLYVCGGITRTIYRLLLAPGVDFIRGDPNGDSITNIADVSFLLNYLFVPQGMVPECLDAADANDDGRVDISDPTYLIFFLFLSGPQPPGPYPTLGPDPTFLDNLGC